jgi:hypothetical protein
MSATLQSQSFYDIQTIQDIRLTFPYSNWDYRLDTAKQGSQGYVLATQCTINGVSFDSVGVKYKGNSSYNANNVKNPLHIKLDWVVGNQDYQGHEDVKLGNGFKDPSMLREVLSYKILRQYMHAPLSNFALLHINGTFIGLYANDQDVGNNFSGEHFFSTGNAFFKCNPSYGGGNTPDLKYYGTDSALYYNKYELQSNSGWGELIDLCDTLNNFPSAIEKILDVDRAIWMLAFDNLTVNLDSYIGAIKQNYYLYRDDNGRFNPVVWDLNECFGTFSNTGTGPGLNLTGMINLSPDLHLNDANWPLIMRLLSSPRYKRMYIAHMRTMMEENFANNLYESWAADLRSIIDSAVQADPNKFFTYSQFLNAMTQNVTTMGTSPGISNLMDPRVAYLQGLAEFQAVPPTIQTPVLSNPAPAFGDTIAVTCNVSNATFVRLGYRMHRSLNFTYVQMFDDGAHNDGTSGDGVYGAEMPCQSGLVEYYVYADNSSAGAFLPARAEHEFFSILTVNSGLVQGDLVLNEFMAVNQTSVTDPAGDYSDWLELKNNTSADLNLYGMYLSDDALQSTKWAFPSTAVIPANGYLIVWLDEDDFQPGLHANFKLSSAGEEILLGYASGARLDSVVFGAQTVDQSMQRCPDGTGAFAMANHTHAAVNSCVTATDHQTEPSTIRLYPNPSQGKVVLDGLQVGTPPMVFDATMRKLNLKPSLMGKEWLIDMTPLPDGIYWVVSPGLSGLKVVLQR